VTTELSTCCLLMACAQCAHDAVLVAAWCSASGVLVEYVMLDGVNDAEEHAEQLGTLLQGRDVFVNLIPYNPAAATDTYRASSQLSLTYFQHVLRDLHGIHTTVRQEMGQDIAGACGQLVIQAKGSERTPDIEDIAFK
jgi:adenine C2-methylase RlmN of 23S rRNA A2503 and tRNA A37